MSFRLVANPVTLSDLERRNSPYVVLFHERSVAFGGECPHYVKVVKDTPYFLRQKCSPKNVVFSDISLRLWRYWQAINRRER